VWLGLAVALLVAAVFLGMRWLAPLVPFSWEQRMAQPVIDQWRGSADEPPAARERRAWLQSLAERLQPAMQWPADMPVTVHWLDSEEPNAFATLGGHVFIHQGLLDRVDSENAVAMVLAHEMAHVKHRDPIVALGGGLTVGLALQAVFGGGGMVGSGSGVAGEAAAALSQLSFSRRQERAADAAALAALQAHYGHLADADAFFARMLCEELTGSAPEFLQTHPDTAGRVAAIRAREAGSSQAAGKPVPLPAFMKGGKKPAACSKVR
jgi:predicted Zn-dependent protease